MKTQLLNINLNIILAFLLALPVLSAQNGSFEETECFHQYASYLTEADITWGYLSVPEDWDNPNTDSIKIAVSVLKNKAKKSNAEALVFIQGGPGAPSVEDVWSWLEYKLREDYDIILFDIRGTGYSEPSLCPDLGKEFLSILAKNQPPSEDEKQKTNAALACKQELIKKGINGEAYNSIAVANDMHALKSALGYKSWNIYGVSYGSYTSQVYASMFPNDIDKIVLDSSIPDISSYYTDNTDNYMISLDKVFQACKADPKCSETYSGLKNTYFEVIADLKKNPISVPVDKNLVESETFTFNSEDFKVAVQQALYNKQLIEVIPLLISQFHERNEDAIGNLVPAFSSLLAMDYGVYYCVSCNETLPRNSFSEYTMKGNSIDRLDGPISFYESDFKVCEAWNLNRKDSLHFQDLSSLKEANFPVLVFAGEFDPITPEKNGLQTANNFKNSNAVTAFTYGHVPSFTNLGNQAVANFIREGKFPEANTFKEAKALQIVNEVTTNAGVSKLGASLQEQNLMFLGPLILAILFMIAFIFVHGIKLLRKKYPTTSDKIVRVGCLLSSILGIATLAGYVNALLNTLDLNYFILAFGLPSNYDYLYNLTVLFLIIFGLTTLYYFIKIKHLHERSILFSVIFSHILLAVYLIYWGITPF